MCAVANDFVLGRTGRVLTCSTFLGLIQVPARIDLSPTEDAIAEVLPVILD